MAAWCFGGVQGGRKTHRNNPSLTDYSKAKSYKFASSRIKDANSHSHHQLQTTQVTVMKTSCFKIECRCANKRIPTERQLLYQANRGRDVFDFYLVTLDPMPLRSVFDIEVRCFVLEVGAESKPGFKMCQAFWLAD